MKNGSQTKPPGRGLPLQDELLERVKDNDGWTTLFLKDRSSLRGRVLAYDAFVILMELDPDSPPVMVYKSAVVSFNPPRRQNPRGR